MMRSLTNNDKPGVAFKRPEAVPSSYAFKASREALIGGGAAVRVGNRLSFAGLYLFTLLLYVRPNELFPGTFSNFPILKIVAIMTLVIYIVSMLNQGRPLTVWPLETSLVISIALLGIIFIPFAVSPQDTTKTLFDIFLKIVLVFVLIVNLIDTRERLHSLLKLVLICGSVLAISAIKDFFTGNLDRIGRIEGAVGGMFGNPNDLATSMDLLVPLAVALALSRKGLIRLIYAGCSLLLGAAVVITFSRSGFLGLMALIVLLLWKLRSHDRVISLVLAVLIVCALVLMVPTSYGGRLLTILHPEMDKTGSAQERQILLQRVALVAVRHSAIGIGMGNFHLYSFRELKSHNSYLEIWAELGLAGLVVYLTLIFASLRSLRRIQFEKIAKWDRDGPNESYFLSVGLQATLAAYIVCGFFASIQYQWYLYYPVAYAVALRRIHAFETMESRDVNVKSAAAVAAWSDSTTGLLWRTNGQRRNTAHAGFCRFASREEVIGL